MRKSLGIVLPFALLISGAAVAQPTGPGGDFPPGPPNSWGLEAYKNCISDSLQNNTVGQRGDVIVFRCSGEPAQQFFDAVAVYSQSRGYEVLAPRTVIRRFNGLKNDDRCWRADNPGVESAYDCVLLMRGAPFVDPNVPPTPPRRRTR